MTPQEAINNLENSLSTVHDSIKSVLRALKEMSSDEVLNGSISEAQKILAKILPIDESSKKIEKVHQEFLSLLEELEIKKKSPEVEINSSSPLASTQVESEKTADEKVSFDDVANQLNDLVEEEIEEKVSEQPKVIVPNVTSSREYRIQILKALIYLGGSAKIEEIYNFIERDMKSKFKTVDLEDIDSNGNKNWNEAVKKERMAMVDEGLLSADSTNGTWEIVQKGIDYLSNHAKA